MVRILCPDYDQQQISEYGAKNPFNTLAWISCPACGRKVSVPIDRQPVQPSRNLPAAEAMVARVNGCPCCKPGLEWELLP